jgi:hypothetical protein
MSPPNYNQITRHAALRGEFSIQRDAVLLDETESNDTGIDQSAEAPPARADVRVARGSDGAHTMDRRLCERVHFGVDRASATICLRVDVAANVDAVRLTSDASVIAGGEHAAVSDEDATDHGSGACGTRRRKPGHPGEVLVPGRALAQAFFGSSFFNCFPFLEWDEVFGHFYTFLIQSFKTRL